MKRRMVIMLVVVLVLFAGIFIFKAIKNTMIKHFLDNQSKAVTVSTMKVDYSLWQSTITAAGSLRAIRGVNVTTELAGMVQHIYFTPGAIVKMNTVLVQLNADSDLALLHSLEANAELARVTYIRDKAQYAAQAVSKQTLDTDEANLKSLRAQVAQQMATVAKKTIVAPFDGRLGINNVNPGQYINTGDKVVSLQTLNPLYVDFYVPQQQLAKLKVGLEVIVTSDSFVGKKYRGKITTIDPAVDVNTRNVEVEATIQNPNNELSPGMFVYVAVKIGEPQSFLTLPQTAITFNPYGEIVYMVNEKGKDKEGKPILIANEGFVVTGDMRGDQVSILKGLKAGDTVVTSGQLKLKNGSEVIINNTVQPLNNPAPKVRSER